MLEAPAIPPLVHIQEKGKHVLTQKVVQESSTHLQSKSQEAVWKDHKFKDSLGTMFTVLLTTAKP